MATKERVHGPYQHRSKWRVVGVKADGSRIRESFDSHAEAQEYADTARAALGHRTVGIAVNEFLANMVERGRRWSTVTTARYRLVAFLRLTETDRPLVSLTEAHARSLYAKRVGEVKADTHRGELALASGFASWCVKRGYLPSDPFAGVEAVGERRTGKEQLRLDEARRFLGVAIGEGSHSGLAAALALLTGARASEVTDRIVRDLDDGGRLLWVSKAKTKAGIRQLVVPEVLRARMLELAVGRQPGDRLWGDVTRHWLGHHVRRLCAAAKVPVVSPHGLRGLYATIRVGVLGDDADRVAASLGQETAQVTRRSYVAPGAESRMIQTQLADRITATPSLPVQD